MRWQRFAWTRSTNEGPEGIPPQHEPDLCAECHHTREDHVFGKCDALDNRVRCECKGFVEKVREAC